MDIMTSSARARPAPTSFKGKYVEFCERQSSASLCELKMQKMRVDCCFLLSKTRWGSLHGKDAGIMYLDLTFHQPAKCKLSHATITLHFHEIDGGEPPSQGTSELEVTEFFGPRSLTAEKRERQVSTTLEANPSVGIGGATFQGVKFARSSVVSYASRWQFEGCRFALDTSGARSHSRDSRYRQLVWHLQENELEKQATQQNIVHSAVAFTYQSKPFYLDVKIKANLYRWQDRLKQSLVCPPRHRSASARAIVQTSLQKSIAPDFEKLARDLDNSMIQANMHPVTENAVSNVTDDTETLGEPDPAVNLPEDFVALIERHSGQSLPGVPSAAEAGSHVSVSTSSSRSTLSESSTLVGEAEAHGTKLNEAAQTEVVQPNSSRPQGDVVQGTACDSTIISPEPVQVQWQPSQFLALWTASLITAMIAGLQIMQAAILRERHSKDAQKKGR